MIHSVKPAALLLIDWQKGFDDWAYWKGERNNPQAEKNARLLLDAWRRRAWPVFHIQHASTLAYSILAPTHPGHVLKEELQPMGREPLIQKRVNSAFIGTDLQQQLLDYHTDQVVLTGLTTDHCVSTTARMAANLGFETFIIQDATAAFSKKGILGEPYTADQIHLTALAQLKDEFAHILSTNDVLYFLRSAVSNPATSHKIGLNKIGNEKELEPTIPYPHIACQTNSK